MRTDRQYLDQSKNGWFSYNRRIPSNIKHLPEMQSHTTFFKRSFKTKDRVLAELEADKLDAWFDSLMGLVPKSQSKTTKERVRRIKDELRIRHLLQQDLKPEEAADYVNDQKNLDAHWRKQAELLSPFRDDWDFEGEVEFGEMPDFSSNAFKNQQSRNEEIERLLEKLDAKYSDGHGGHVKPNAHDEDVIKLKILQGGYGDVPMEDTFGDAVNLYAEHYIETKRTNDNQRHHYVSQIRSISNRIASGLEKGLDTPLRELSRDEVKRIAERIWPNANTRNTNLSGRMVAVINHWNENNPKNKVEPNPFSKLVGQRQIAEDTRTRRSATPAEFAAFWSNLEAPEVDPEIRLIGMMQIYVGCPAGETAGMQRKDLKLQVNVPHVVLRNNSLRLLGKKRLERCVPLVGPILQYWQDYVANGFSGGPDAPLFPRHGQGKYRSQAMSKKLGRLVENIQGGDDLLSAYSLRHTFMDRYNAAGVPEAVGAYLSGHINSGSSAVHKQYGGVQHPENFVDHMIAIEGARDKFGYIEHIDAF